MFKDIVNKHTTLFLKDGAILEGFVVDVNENYIKLVELNNEIVIQCLSEVGTIRTGIKQTVKTVEKPCFSVVKPVPRRVFKECPPTDEEECPPPINEEEYFTPIKDDFAMVNSVYRSPTFVRQTKPDDIEE
jgi:hypothetical protein